MRTEKEKMLAGEMYDPYDAELLRERLEARRKVRIFNQSLESEPEERITMLKNLLGSTGENVYMEPNIRFDYGSNTYVGENFFANFDCVILDVCDVKIGDNCMMAPGVHIYIRQHILFIQTSVILEKNMESLLRSATMFGLAEEPSLIQG